MKSYVITTGLVFGVLAVLHVLRIFHENHDLASEPWYLAITALAAALCAWAAWLVLRERRGAGRP
jgi:hypothetical protein